VTHGQSPFELFLPHGHGQSIFCSSFLIHHPSPITHLLHPSHTFNTYLPNLITRCFVSFRTTPSPSSSSSIRTPHSHLFNSHPYCAQYDSYFQSLSHPHTPKPTRPDHITHFDVYLSITYLGTNRQTDGQTDVGDRYSSSSIVPANCSDWSSDRG
jgi:hypothetical protein